MHGAWPATVDQRRRCTHGRAGGDTFTLRAYSSDVILPSPPLRVAGAVLAAPQLSSLPWPVATW